METDEDFARKLQAEFNEEARLAEEQECQDAALAHTLASQSHSLSDSDEETEEASGQGAAHGVTPYVSPRKPKVLVGDTGDTRTVGSGVNCTSPRKQVPNEKAVVHDLSDEDEDKLSSPQANEEPKVLETHKDPQVSKASQKLHKNGSARSADKTLKTRPLCKFGSDCYRKNPWHLEEFYHPHLEDGRGETAGNSSTEPTGGKAAEPPKKKPRESSPDNTGKKTISFKKSFPARLSASAPFNLFLNKSYSIKETHEDSLSLVFPDLLSSHFGEIVESVQLNFMVDLEFLMSNYKAGRADGKPLLVMYGQMEGDTKDFSSVTCVKVNLPFIYGTHHTKMMIFEYRDGLRVVVHTANLVPDDWYEKTQGFWVSPIFPLLVHYTADGKASSAAPDPVSKHCC